VPHRRKLLLFILLSCIDLLLTTVLLGRDSLYVYEANPLAGWWLGEFGILGLGLFKLTTLLVAITAILLLVVYRPLLAGRVLWFGCAVVGSVVLYSCSLGGYLEAALPSEAEIAALEAPILHPDNSNSPRRVCERVVADLLEKHCTLSEAVSEVSPLFDGQNAVFLEMLARQYPQCSTEELIAVSLMEDVLATLNRDPAETRRRWGELEEEYRSAFHQEPPWTQAEPVRSRPAA
jgi:hypothetical protein